MMIVISTIIIKVGRPRAERATPAATGGGVGMRASRGMHPEVRVLSSLQRCILCCVLCGPYEVLRPLGVGSRHFSRLAPRRARSLMMLDAGTPHAGRSYRST